MPHEKNLIAYSPLAWLLAIPQTACFGGRYRRNVIVGTALFYRVEYFQVLQKGVRYP